MDWWPNWTARDGGISIDVSGDNAGNISQTFATENGSKYIVSFWLAGNPWGGPTIKTLSVSAGNITDKQFTFDTTGKDISNMGWTEKSFTFTAVGIDTTLIFQSLDGTWYGPAIDLVSVEKAPVPLPSALYLLAPGLFGLVGIKRKYLG
ncbi:MAG: DUF642 domain-containing protein [Proteobacteria bacterium]|nr:DUF642 domain-containing protein [Pseudomonadota bacterium]